MPINSRPPLWVEPLRSGVRLGRLRDRRISLVVVYPSDRLLSEPTAGTQACRRKPLIMRHCGPLTASKASLDRVENPPLSLAIAGRRPGKSAATLIARHVGRLHDAEEGASGVLKHNEVVPSTIPPRISPRSQTD